MKLRSALDEEEEKRDQRAQISLFSRVVYIAEKKISIVSQEPPVIYVVRTWGSDTQLYINWPSHISGPKCISLIQDTLYCLRAI